MTDYASARATLLDAEVELMQQRERVALLRRELPPGPEVQDYEFDSSDGPVRLSELVADRPLVLYHFMFGKKQEQPCPMCSMWTDGWNAVAEHVRQSLDFAVVTAASAAENAELVADRGWESLRWLSAAGNTFKADLGGEDAEGHQSPFLTVFTRVDDRPRLAYSGGAHLRDDLWRGVDLLSPVWHLLDLTPDGRGDFMPSLEY